jgi:hypothetical protein
MSTPDDREERLRRARQHPRFRAFERAERELDRREQERERARREEVEAAWRPMAETVAAAIEGQFEVLEEELRGVGKLSDAGDIGSALLR